MFFGCFFEGVVVDNINNSIQEAISSSLRIQRYQHLHRTNKVSNEVLVEWIWASDYRSRQVRQCNLAFGANPFNTITKKISFFNWYQFTLAFSQMMYVVVYAQSNISWSIELTNPPIFILVSCFLFFGACVFMSKSNQREAS